MSYQSTIKYPYKPEFQLNSTIYYHLNNKLFECVGASSKKCDYSNPCKMDAEDMGLAYVLIYNKTYIYRVNFIALKVYSDHVFENVANDLEFQIYHTLEGPDPKDVDPNLNPFTDDRDFTKLAISVRFTASRNVKSFNNFIDQLVEVNPKQKMTFETKAENYNFSKVYDLDFNRYTNFDEPYYYYYGTSTVDKDDFKLNTPVNWIVMKRVQDMSMEELRKVQLALIHNCDTFIINKIPTCETSTEGKLAKCSNNGANYQEPEKA